METLLHRHRDKTVLVLVIFAQLVLIAVQVRNDRDVRMIRVWSVTAVTPLARVLETVRGGGVGFFRNYIMVQDARVENRRLQAELDHLKMENHFLKTELSTADRAKALVAFQQRSQPKSVAARVIATGAGANSKLVFVDRGSGSGVEKGMPVVTPDGIVGKVIAAYPTASEVMLVTDPDFAAGVVSQKSRVAGTLKGQGYANCRVDYVPSEEKVEVGDWFYTSGDDRVFPRGFPVGVVRAVRTASPYKEILVEPSGLEHGLEAVLIMIEGMQQIIPEAQSHNAPVYLAPPIALAPGEQATAPSGAGTDADRLRQRYMQLGDAQGHIFGEGLPGSKPPDFNMKLPAAGQGAAQPKATEGASRRAGEPANSPGVSPQKKTAPLAGDERTPGKPANGVARSPARPLAGSQSAPPRQQ